MYMYMCTYIKHTQIHLLHPSTHTEENSGTSKSTEYNSCISPADKEYTEREFRHCREVGRKVESKLMQAV